MIMNVTMDVDPSFLDCRRVKWNMGQHEAIVPEVSPHTYLLVPLPDYRMVRIIVVAKDEPLLTVQTLMDVVGFLTRTHKDITQMVHFVSGLNHRVPFRDKVFVHVVGIGVRPVAVLDDVLVVKMCI